MHLLITSDYEDSLSRIIQHLARQHFRCLNRSCQRSGTLWEGGHKGSLADAEPCLLHCYRYIELNPVTARMVGAPDQYRCSSYHHKARGRSREAREQLPRFGQSRMEVKTEHEIGECVSANRVLGGKDCRRQVELRLGRRFNHGVIGRPVDQN